MTETRRVKAIVEPQAVMEGAGVRLRRSIGTREVNYLDPFLLLDDFGSHDRNDYEAGFPLHPHRGIETVTYILSGAVQHKDTLGNAGSIGAGDIQWMTSGRGILHEEMPQVRPEGIAGFQLWVNLPAKVKMTGPRYQDVRADRIPESERRDGRGAGAFLAGLGQAAARADRALRSLRDEHAGRDREGPRGPPSGHVRPVVGRVTPPGFDSDPADGIECAPGSNGPS